MDLLVMLVVFVSGDVANVYRWVVGGEFIRSWVPYVDVVFVDVGETVRRVRWVLYVCVDDDCGAGGDDDDWKGFSVVNAKW